MEKIVITYIFGWWNGTISGVKPLTFMRLDVVWQCSLCYHMLLSVSALRKKKIFCSLHYFVNLQYNKAVMAVSTSHVARSHPANCKCEKQTDKYVHSVTYFPYATMWRAIIWDIFNNKLKVPFWEEWKHHEMFQNEYDCKTVIETNNGSMDSFGGGA